MSNGPYERNGMSDRPMSDRPVSDRPNNQRVHAVTACRRPDSNRRWLTPGLKATNLDHSVTTFVIKRRTLYYATE